MQIFLVIYTVLMLFFSLVSLSLVPHSLRDLGHERQRVEEELPGADFARMLEAGYRLNVSLILVELLYYLLLLRFAGDSDFLYYGAFAFGLVHISYLVTGRLERRRIARGYRRVRGARLLIWITATLTSLETGFLVAAAYIISA